MSSINPCRTKLDNMPPDMTDKCVSTDNDFTIQMGGVEMDYEGNSQWKMLQLQQLLAALVDSKVVAKTAGSAESQNASRAVLQRLSIDNWSSRSSSPEYKKSKQKQKRSEKRCHCHHHTLCKARAQQRRAKMKARARATANPVLKIRRWSQDIGVVTIARVREADEVELELSMDQRDHQHQHPGYIEVDMEGRPKGSRSMQKRKRRRKRARRRRGRDHDTERGHMPIDPEDLPKRARWTIIITAGLLLMTCMLLVGITLRMAPIIDQIVLSQNEELMNSINRQQILQLNNSGS